MLVIYHCFGGSHSSVTAAAIHLGFLPRDRVPTAAEFLTLPYFDARSKGEEGEVRFMGKDREGNHIYTAGKKKLGSRFEALLHDLAEALGIAPQKIIFINTSSLVTLTMRIGGFISRRLGIAILGRPLVIWGIRRAYFQIVNFVTEKEKNIIKGKTLE